MSYLRIRGLSSLVKFFLSSSISTDSSILGRMLVMYFLKESTGWYFLCEVARGTDLPASLFLTTSSMKPDFMFIILIQVDGFIITRKGKYYWRLKVAAELIIKSNCLFE